MRPPRTMPMTAQKAKSKIAPGSKGGLSLAQSAGFGQ